MSFYYFEFGPFPWRLQSALLDGWWWVDGWEVADGELGSWVLSAGEIISLDNVRKMRILSACSGQCFQLLAEK